MPTGYFRIELTIEPKAGGDADLVPPAALREVSWHYVIVKDGAEEAIVKVEAPGEVLKKIDADERCAKLTQHQLRSLRAGYPPPKIKRRYRMHAPTAEQTAAGLPVAQPELDDAGNRVVETVQTVRSGFYLIDVPLAPSES